MTATTAAPPDQGPGPGAAPGRGLRLAAVYAATLGALAVVAVAHLGQGTAAVGLADIASWVAGHGTDTAAAVVLESRLPRLLAGLLVGVALGVAGAALQSVSRNILASPDTLAVNAAAHCALVACAASGVTLPLLGQGATAFAGGLAGAAIVLAVAGGATNTLRLILAGTALATAFSSLAYLLMLLYAMETRGLFAWGAGALGQNGLAAVTTYAPLVAAGTAVLLLHARRLDLLGLGDATATVLGVPVARTKATAVLAAVALAAAAVTVAGPVGFVGLCAPALARLLAPAVPGLHRHLALLPLSGLLGVLLILGSDVLLRAAFGPTAGVEVPVGVVTSIIGAVFLVVLARRLKETPAAPGEDTVAAPARTLPYPLVLAAAAALVAGTATGALLLGDATLLLGDLAAWWQGQAGPVVTHVLGTRAPRVAAALLAGAALALAGTVVQAVTRNPLAEPGILGVAGGAGLGAVAVITLVPLASYWTVTGAACLGAAAAAALVLTLAAAGGMAQGRLILTGVAVSAGSLALIALLIITTDPWNGTKALTWLAGSTYGRTAAHLAPIAAAAAVTLPLLAAHRRELDLLSLDETTPRVLGVPVTRARVLLLAAAVLLTAASVTAAGVVAFVGLIAPHAARALAGRRHSRVLPVAALLGAALTCLADTVGRTVIAPAQIPVGLTVALVGTPYFLYLLTRVARGAPTR